MELEFFCHPGTEKHWFNHWKSLMYDFLILLGMNPQNLMFKYHKKEELSHYSQQTCDILFKFPWGFDELLGIASRTNFDLQNHQRQSKKNLTYFDETTKNFFLPYVIESSLGIERLFLAFLINNYHEEKNNSNEIRQILTFHPFLSPYKVAILPLIKNIHSSKSHQIHQYFAKYFDVCYDETQSIGKRYRRQDMIGTPFCLTVDDQTLSHNTVTLRNRDTATQQIFLLTEAKKYIQEQIIFK
jgi:glycyl-tRNA synthetase